MEAEAAPVGAPVTADTRRHAATLPDTTRHGGLGLQNHRLQVRFLSHLPLTLNSWGLLPH